MICYTVITNQCDTLKDPLVVTPGWQYICFSDQPIQSKVWEFRKIENKEHADREVKILGHKFLDGVTLYVDGNIRIVGDLNDFINEISSVWSMFVHNKRNCIYQEGERVVGRWFELREAVDQQMDRYHSEGFPEEYGLGQNNILLRDFSNSKVRKLNELWWGEFGKGVPRDQLSLMYCFWKMGWYPNLLPIYRHRLFFKKKKHYVY